MCRKGLNSDRLLPYICLQVLRLVDNHDRVCVLDELNGPFTGQFIVRFVDDVLVFGERINVDYQGLIGLLRANPRKDETFLES